MQIILTHFCELYQGKKHSDAKDAPKPKIRSSIHPAVSGSYGNDDDDDDEEIQSPVLVIPPGTMPEDVSFNLVIAEHNDWVVQFKTHRYS